VYTSLAGKKPLGRPRCRCVDYIKLDPADILWSGVDWFGLAEDRNRWRALVDAVTNF
jgi:hypothetical protein